MKRHCTYKAALSHVWITRILISNISILQLMMLLLINHHLNYIEKSGLCLLTHSSEAVITFIIKGIIWEFNQVWQVLKCCFYFHLQQAITLMLTCWLGSWSPDYRSPDRLPLSSPSSSASWNRCSPRSAWTLCTRSNLDLCLPIQPQPQNTVICKSFYY